MLGGGALRRIAFDEGTAHGRPLSPALCGILLRPAMRAAREAMRRAHDHCPPLLRVHLAEYRTGIWYRLVPGTVEVLSRYCSDPVLRFAVAIATAIFPTHDLALIRYY
eukprot:SAG11_NODE_53_length_19648_cov_14.691902_4_plen_108_part_00